MAKAGIICILPNICQRVSFEICLQFPCWGPFTNYVILSRWVGGQQNITIANFTKVDDSKMLAKT